MNFKTLESINLQVGRAVRWLALVMVLVQFVAVLLRYLYGISFIALDESVLYMHGALFMLAGGYTLAVDKHVRVDIFYSRFSRCGKRRIDIIGHLVFLIPANLVLLIYTWPSVRSSWRILEGPISVGGIPASFVLKSMMSAFCVLLLIQGAVLLAYELGFKSRLNAANDQSSGGAA